MRPASPCRAQDGEYVSSEGRRRDVRTAGRILNDPDAGTAATATATTAAATGTAGTTGTSRSDACGWAGTARGPRCTTTAEATRAASTTQTAVAGRDLVSKQDGGTAA